jgi:REP element-mobilizing transposase RayT
MGHTHHKLLVHVVFATKDRLCVLTPDIRARLFPFLGGIARAKGLTALAVGGHTDHVHLLLQLPPTMDVAKAVQLLKGESSGWIRKEFARSVFPGWQEGYGAFTIGVTQVAATIRYIEGQEEHHRRKPFAKEFDEFLRKHGFEELADRGGTRA